MSTPFRFPPFPKARVALGRLRRAQPAVIERAGVQMALRVFRYAAATVPAYQALLKQHGIKPASIRTRDDLAQLPTVGRADYLVSNTYADLFPDGVVRGATTVAATSGTSGEPFYFPRDHRHDEQYRHIAELILHNQWDISTQRTLGVIGFGLGIWIGGMFTYKIMDQIAGRTGNLTLAPVGADIGTYVQTIAKLAPHFDQVLLMGYPPFIRDVLEHSDDIPWKRIRTRILTAAEGYSEQFRNHLIQGAHLRDPLIDTTNIYGTVELGTMAHETPLANLIRRIAVDQPDVMRAILPHPTRQPTLAQYHPNLTYFDEQDGELFGTGYASSIPLVRYRFRDVGGLIRFDDMVARLSGAGIDVMREAQRAGIDRTVLKLPFVYVYERNDNTLTIRGANLFADEIRSALETCAPSVTTRFAMMKEEDRDAHGVVRIHVELGKSAKPSVSLERKVTDAIVSTLLEKNSEFRCVYTDSPERTRPRITLAEHRHPTYFSRAGKQRWLIQSKKK